MNERDFFARDIATPERFEKYLKVVVNGPSVESPPRSPKRHPQRFKDEGAFEFAFDPDTIDSEEVHENILKIVDDEMSIDESINGDGVYGSEDASNKETVLSGVRKSRRSIRRRASLARRRSMNEKNTKDDSSSVVSIASAESLNESVLSLDPSVSSYVSFDDSAVANQQSSSAASLDSRGTLETKSFANNTLATNQTQVSTISAHSAAMLGQIRRSRGVKEQSDSEIESLVMLLGLNRRSVQSMKQRHFESRTFKNLYAARTESLSNDYYLPRTVIDVLEREEMMKTNKSKVDTVNILAAERQARKLDDIKNLGRRDDEASLGDASTILTLDDDSIESGTSKITIQSGESLESMGIPKEISTR